MINSKHLLPLVVTVLAVLAIFLVNISPYLATSFTNKKSLLHNEQKKTKPEDTEIKNSEDTVDLSQLTNTPFLHTDTATGKNFLPLKSEQFFFKKNEPSVSQVSELIAGNSFREAINALDSESIRNPETAEITNIYRNEALKAIPSSFDLRLTNFACGLSVCAASFLSSSDENGFTNWYQNFQQNPNMPHSIGFDFTLALDSRNQEHRIVFYIDPRHNSTNF